MGIFSRWHVVFDLFILFALVCLSKEQNEEFVRDVNHHFSDRLSSRLVQLIMNYHRLETAYKAYAAYFDRADVDLHGFSKFFNQLEEYALKIAINMTTYINKRGGITTFSVIKLEDACKIITKFQRDHGKPHICYFQSDLSKSGQNDQPKPNIEENLTHKTHNWKRKPGLQGLKDALIWEKFIKHELTDIYDRKVADPYTKLVMATLTEYHVDTIKRVADLEHRLQSHQNIDNYDLEEYLMDTELDK